MGVAAALRRFWLNVHLWLGIALLIPLLLIGVTGSVLAFHEELERITAPQRFAASPGPALDPSALLAAAREAAGEGFVVASLRLPEHAGDPVVAQARATGGPRGARPPQSVRLWLDPATGEVLDQANPRGGVFGVMHQLHGSLLIPEIGRKVVGWFGWGLLISALTGIWIWWPRGSFLKALAWRQKPLFTYNLHHFFGFWIAIPLAIVAATGVYISFPQTARQWTQAVAGEQPRGGRESGGAPRGGGQPLEETALTIDDVAMIARAAAPGAELVALTLPTRARGDHAPEWRAEARSGEETLRFTIADAAGAQAERTEPPQGATALLMRRIHDGVDQPLWWRIIVVLTGIAPPLLGVTGLIFWLRKNKQKAA